MNYNFIHLTDLSNYINFKISHIFHVTVGREWHAENRCENVNRVYFILDGHGSLYHNGQTIDLLPNNIYLIPANLCYSYACDDAMEKLFVHFSVSIIPQKDLLSAINRIVRFEISEEEMTRIKHIFYEETIQSAMFCQSYIRNLLFEITDSYEEQINRDMMIYKKYSQLYQYIVDHVYADTTVSQICNYTGFSQRHLSYKFKQDTGQTIKAYLTGLIVDKLKYMLQCTSLPIKEISAMLHFNSEFYCSKFFKKHMGISPREYRNKHGNIDSDFLS